MGTIIKKIKINEGMKKIIEENALGLATVDKNNKPHNIAVGFVRVISENELLISDNYFDETVNNIKNNANVSLVVWIQDWKENCVGYELAGIAEYYPSGKYIEMIKKIPENKDAPCKGAILVKISKIKLLD